MRDIASAEQTTIACILLIFELGCFSPRKTRVLGMSPVIPNSRRSSMNFEELDVKMLRSMGRTQPWPLQVLPLILLSWSFFVCLTVTLVLLWLVESVLYLRDTTMVTYSGRELNWSNKFPGVRQMTGRVFNCRHELSASFQIVINSGCVLYPAKYTIEPANVLQLFEPQFQPIIINHQQVGAVTSDGWCYLNSMWWRVRVHVWLFMLCDYRNKNRD